MLVGDIDGPTPMALGRGVATFHLPSCMAPERTEPAPPAGHFIRTTPGFHRSTTAIICRQAWPSGVSMDADIQIMLERRLGRLYARQRLGIERELEGKVFGRGRKHFHIENWYSAGSLITFTLKACGLYGLGRRNADRVVLRENLLTFPDLPAAFDDFTILHL